MGNKTVQRILVTIFGLAFIGSTGAAVIPGLLGNGNKTSQEQSVNDAAVEEEVRIRASGYEKVLEREPKNYTALSGLAEIYLQTGNMEKAIPPLEKLAEYYPEQPQFAALLAEIKKQQARQTTEPDNSKQPANLKN
jgi:cytochrome c-type biogenesis protein CcmH/NrfG